MNRLKIHNYVTVLTNKILKFIFYLIIVNVVANADRKDISQITAKNV
jgi:hypothetical protein